MTSRRNIMAPVKKAVEQPQPVPVQAPEREMNEEIFELPKNEGSTKSKSKRQSKKAYQEDVSPEIPETIVEDREPDLPSQTPQAVKKKRDYSHLAKAREKSLEARRKKKAEKESLMSDVDAYKEKLEYERLLKKYGKMEISPSQAKAPPPQPQYEPPPQKRADPVPQRAVSVRPEVDMSNSVIDYDRLIGGVAERLSKQNDYYAQVEKDIRADERKKADKHYQEQLKSWEQQQHRQHQREQSYNVLSGSYRRNQVFDRTKKLRDAYTERYKNGWY